MTPLRPTLLASHALLCLALVAGAGPAHAQAKESKEAKHARKAAEQAYAQEALRRGEILPMGQILELVRRGVPGDLLKIELDNGRLAYKVKVLTPDGRIRKLELAARDGSIIKSEAQ